MRVLLIQKEVKRRRKRRSRNKRLRVLLIQKEVKPFARLIFSASCLRVLLIQKEVKQIRHTMDILVGFESLVNTEGSKTVSSR